MIVELFFNLNLSFYFKKGRLIGNVSPYEVVCNCFRQLIFENTEVEGENKIESEEQMKTFFANFAIDAQQSFTTKMIYKGYIDDPRNTDNS